MTAHGTLGWSSCLHHSDPGQPRGGPSTAMLDVKSSMKRRLAAILAADIAGQLLEHTRAFLAT